MQTTNSGCYVGAAATYDYFHGGVPDENVKIYKGLGTTSPMLSENVTLGITAHRISYSEPRKESGHVYGFTYTWRIFDSPVQMKQSFIM